MVHDLAESLVGDITPYDGVSKEDKRKLEEVKISTVFHISLMPRSNMSGNVTFLQLRQISKDKFIVSFSSNMLP